MVFPLQISPQFLMFMIDYIGTLRLDINFCISYLLLLNKLPPKFNSLKQQSVDLLLILRVSNAGWTKLVPWSDLRSCRHLTTHLGMGSRLSAAGCWLSVGLAPPGVSHPGDRKGARPSSVQGATAS